VLQCVAEGIAEDLQCVAVCYSVLANASEAFDGTRANSRCVAVCCGVLQCVAVRCSVLQCVAVCCSG